MQDKQERIRDIEKSTDPSMDEKGLAGTSIEGGYGYGPSHAIYEEMTKREALLYELKNGKLVSSWRSYAEIDEKEEERLKYYIKNRREEMIKEKEELKRKKIEAIMFSKDPSMDDKVYFEVYNSEEDEPEKYDGRVYLSGMHYYHSVIRYRKTETIME